MNTNHNSCFTVNEYHTHSSEDESAHLFDSECVNTIQKIISHINQLEANMLELDNKFDKKLISDSKALFQIKKYVQQTVIHLTGIINMI